MSEQTESNFYRYFKIAIVFIICFIATMSFAHASEYTESIGDSIMVVGVNFAKTQQDPTKYIATINVDLNYYKQSADPTKVAQYVKQYYWSNWWDATLIGNLFNDAFVQSKYSNFNFLNTDGTINTTYLNGLNETTELMPYYYAEIDGGFVNTETGECFIGEYPTQTKVPCGDVTIPTNRVGFYGLPFYIQSVEFVCDKNDLSKGYKKYTQEAVRQDVSLTRPSYPSINGPNIQLNGLKIPMAFEVPGFVRLDGLKFVTCERMDTTTNAGIKVLFKPNPLYRRYNPNTAGAEQWAYSDIISGLGPGYTSSDILPFELNMSFNYSGNWWSYQLVNGSQTIGAFDNSLIPGNASEMDCRIYPNLLSNNLKATLSQIYNDINNEFQLGANEWTIPAKYSELIALDRQRGDTFLQSHINTGDGITCTFEKSVYNNVKDGAISTSVENELSVELQKRNAIQLDLLDKKLETKRFIAKTIVPFFAIFIIIIFYVFQIALLGFLLFAFLPMFVRYFIKGIKDVFDMSEAKKLMRSKK